MSGARRFTLVRELGSGAFGTVYLAEMESAGGFRRRVALKLLRPEVEEASDASRRLRDEARLLGRLRHRNIVQVDDLVWVNGRWAVVMEFVGGQDLEVVLKALEERGERMPLVAALELARGVATALDAAWAGRADGEEPLRVVHRDIKPSNVRLTEDGEVKVLDFGIARAEFEGREARTGRIRYGSLGYMAPERLLGGEEGPAGDVFAVGCLLYEALAGRPLGRVELAPDRQERQVAEALAQITRPLEDGATPELAPLLGALLGACLAYDEEQRPSAGELSRALGELARQASGEELAAFARRVLPGLVAAAPGQPVQGTLVEVLPGTATPPRGALEALPRPAPRDPNNDSTTFTFAGAVEEGEDAPLAPPAAPPPAAPRRGPSVLGVAVAAGVGVVALGLVAVLALWPATPAPTPPLAPVDALAAAAPSAPPAVVPEPAPLAAVAADPPPVAPPAAPAPAPVGASTGKPSGGPAAPVRTPPPAEPTPPTEPADPAGSPVARVRSAKFAVGGATRVQASCGDRSATGGGSALVRDFPAGSCRVLATVDGRELSALVQVEQARGVDCLVAGEVLECR